MAFCRTFRSAAVTISDPCTLCDFEVEQTGTMLLLDQACENHKAPLSFCEFPEFRYHTVCLVLFRAQIFPEISCHYCVDNICDLISSRMPVLHHSLAVNNKFEGTPHLVWTKKARDCKKNSERSSRGLFCLRAVPCCGHRVCAQACPGSGTLSQCPSIETRGKHVQSLS